MGNCCLHCIRSYREEPPSVDGLCDGDSVAFNHVNDFNKSDHITRAYYSNNGSSNYRPLNNSADPVNSRHIYSRKENHTSRHDYPGTSIFQGARSNRFTNPRVEYSMDKDQAFLETSTSNLQHISEREPDDITDPSLNPTKETLFMQRSNIRKSESFYDRNFPRNRLFSLLHRSNSTSTIWLDDSTVTRPDPKSTVRALSKAVYLQIINRNRSRLPDVLPEIFDESINPIQNERLPENYKNRDPDLRTVHRFIRTLFQMAQLSPECAIVTMVYLERLLTSAESELSPATWKRVVLCAILLASKVWDDQAVWNVDYCQIFKDLSVNDVNELERKFLEIIQFNINVPSSVYAKYYFDIRSLCNADSELKPLSVDRAYKLEAYSRITDDQLYDVARKSRNYRRWHSLNALHGNATFRTAVIS